MYHLIGNTAPFNSAKIHIAKELHNAENSLCGKSLSFDYDLLTVSTRSYDEAELFSKEDIQKIKDVCKVCLKVLNQTK